MQGQGPFIHWAENKSLNEGKEKMTVKHFNSNENNLCLFQAVRNTKVHIIVWNVFTKYI